MPPNTQRCPICSKSVEPSTRYPCYVCGECAVKAISKDGRALIFNNSHIWAGFDVKYVDTGEPYLSHECYIDKIKCYADEAYFGGIVIQAVANYKEDLYRGYWEYQKSHFSHEQRYFEHPYAPNGRPPVFISSESWRNIIINPAAEQ